MDKELTDQAGAPTTDEAAAGGTDDTMVDEQLIEEISIDGMCGVY